jgi:hypothetical protein
MKCTCQPGKGLCFSCLSPIEERNFVKAGSPVNGNGELTLNQIDIFEEQFISTIVADTEQNPLSLAVKQYGNTFYDVTNAINNDFLKRAFIAERIPEYPILSERLKRGAITPLEFAAFIKESNYTPAAAIVSSNANGPRFLNELEAFYNGDFSVSILGGFCSLMTNIFGVINAFFDLVDTLNALYEDALKFIEKIKNIEDAIKAAFEKLKVKALIEAIKKKIVDMIEQAIIKVCMAISNFSVESITGPITSAVESRIVVKVEEEKATIGEFCNVENIRRLVEKIKRLIDYAVGLFSNPSFEEIQFLIARLCALATGLEGLFKGLKAPLNNFGNRYDEVFNTISNASNRVTGEAIRSGAIRMSEESRRQQINNAKDVWEKAGNVRTPTIKEYRDVPSYKTIEKASSSTGVSVGIIPDVILPTPETLPAIPSGVSVGIIPDVVLPVPGSLPGVVANIPSPTTTTDSAPSLKFSGCWVSEMNPPSEGWTKLDMNVKVYLVRLQKAAQKAGLISGPIYINSGWRSVQYNAKVGGAKSSQHLNGLAVDIVWDGFVAKSDKTNQFVALARKEGFRGIGLYNSFVHLDIGPVKQWDKRS